jgi:hypothetical protein
LLGLLPAGLARQAAQLNAASRETGGGRIITAARVDQLGVERISKLVTLGDPGKAALALTRALASVARGPKRDR